MNESQLSVNEILTRAQQAAAVFSAYDQAQTDRIVRAVYHAAFANRVKLARMAQEETGIGVWQDKVIKNVLASQLVYEDIKDLKTVGIISEDKATGIIEIAQPMGPILAIIPVTNPTSTVIFKVLSCLKTRNPVIVCPSRKAANCCAEAARICYEAALAEDAPEDCIQWLTSISREQTHELMTHPGLALILATGGASLVKSAYSSGTPTLGVGAGNVPVFVEKSADVAFAAAEVCLSKTFDNGTICASEQAIVVERELDEPLRQEFIKQGGFFVGAEDLPRLEAVVFDRERGSMNPDIVGKSALHIAGLAGIEVPGDTTLLMTLQTSVSDKCPLSCEILAPVLAWYVADSYEHAVNLCIDLNFHGGIGHTVSMFSNDDARIKEFAMLMNAGRILVNMPSSFGAVGALRNMLSMSFTLGCGAGGKNITTDNVTARHLLNIQRITRRRENVRMMRFDKDLYLDESLGAEAIEAIYNRNC